MMSLFSIKQAACSAVDPYLQARALTPHTSITTCDAGSTAQNLGNEIQFCSYAGLYLFGAEMSHPLAFAAAKNLIDGWRPAA